MLAIVKIILRPIPVVFACRGCELEAAAQRAAAALERRGEGEAAIMGRDATKARSRFPVHAIEGCAKCCASEWLASIGVRPQHVQVLEPDSASESE
jgi:uncharacterized metal-binding protein